MSIYVSLFEDAWKSGSIFKLTPSKSQIWNSGEGEYECQQYCDSPTQTYGRTYIDQTTIFQRQSLEN